MPRSYRDRKKALISITEGLDQFLSEHPLADYDEVSRLYGSPEAVLSSILTDYTPEDFIKYSKTNHRSRLVMRLLLLLVALLLLFFIWSRDNIFLIETKTTVIYEE